MPFLERRYRVLWEPVRWWNVVRDCDVAELVIGHDVALVFGTDRRERCINTGGERVDPFRPQFVSGPQVRRAVLAEVPLVGTGDAVVLGLVHPDMLLAFHDQRRRLRANVTVHRPGGLRVRMAVTDAERVRRARLHPDRHASTVAAAFQQHRPTRHAGAHTPPLNARNRQGPARS